MAVISTEPERTTIRWLRQLSASSLVAAAASQGKRTWYVGLMVQTSRSPKDITDDTRLIDLTVAELLQVLTVRLGLGKEKQAQAARDPARLIDTWEAADLLGIVPKHDPGPEPPTGTSAWRIWRSKWQAVRDDVAHRFQQLLVRRPQLATLAHYDGRRRYFTRADLIRYLDSLDSPARRRRR